MDVELNVNGSNSSKKVNLNLNESKSNGSNSPNNLTPSEKMQVQRLKAMGHSNNEIAIVMGWNNTNKLTEISHNVPNLNPLREIKGDKTSYNEFNDISEDRERAFQKKFKDVHKNKNMNEINQFDMDKMADDNFDYYKDYLGPLLIEVFNNPVSKLPSMTPTKIEENVRLSKQMKNEASKFQSYNMMVESYKSIKHQKLNEINELEEEWNSIVGEVNQKLNS